MKRILLLVCAVFLFSGMSIGQDLTEKELQLISDQLEVHKSYYELSEKQSDLFDQFKIDAWYLGREQTRKCVYGSFTSIKMLRKNIQKKDKLFLDRFDKDNLRRSIETVILGSAVHVFNKRGSSCVKPLFSLCIF